LEDSKEKRCGIWGSKRSSKAYRKNGPEAVKGVGGCRARAFLFGGGRWKTRKQVKTKKGKSAGKGGGAGQKKNGPDSKTCLDTEQTRLLSAGKKNPGKKKEKKWKGRGGFRPVGETENGWGPIHK